MVRRQVDFVQLDPVGLEMVSGLKEHQFDAYCSVLASTKSDPLLGQFQILKHYDNCVGGTTELDSGYTCGNDQPCKCIHKQLSLGLALLISEGTKTRGIIEIGQILPSAISSGSIPTCR
jgi:hypothetical protein